MWLEREYKLIKHQIRAPIWRSARERFMYMQKELEESQSLCKTEYDFQRCKCLIARLAVRS